MTIKLLLNQNHSYLMWSWWYLHRTLHRSVTSHSYVIRKSFTILNYVENCYIKYYLISVYTWGFFSEYLESPDGPPLLINLIWFNRTKLGFLSSQLIKDWSCSEDEVAGSRSAIEVVLFQCLLPKTKRNHGSFVLPWEPPWLWAGV